MAEGESAGNSLDIEVIRRALSPNTRVLIRRLEVLESVESTNDHILALADKGSVYYIACIANQQRLGRGRNGRVWQSPGNANIYMTLGSNFESVSAKELSGVSLACGVAIARLLEKMGLTVQVKWPNDILLGGKKIAGILVETRIRADNIFVAVGIGLNVNMPASSAEKIDQPWVDLRGVLCAAADTIERNELIAELLDVLVECCVEYKLSGFDTFADDWRRFDALSGHQVIVTTDAGETSAKVLGLSENGALRVEIDGKKTLLYAADVKLKMKNNVND